MIRCCLPRLLTAVAILALAVACTSADPEEKLLTELANLDKETIFERAETLFESGKYDKARPYYSFVYDTFPNDPLGRKAALRVADTFAQRRSSADLTEARLRYRDFANRYPNDPDRDYALLMVGRTFTARKPKPDRDLTQVEEALDAYRQLVQLYPDSPYIEEAREQITLLREVLAEHEWLVADFYWRNNRYRGALWRLQYIEENYPDYAKIDQVQERIAKIEEIRASYMAEVEPEPEPGEKSDEDHAGDDASR